MVIGTPVSGRVDAHLERILGFFLNTVALRVRCAAESTFRDVLRQAREMALAAYEHQDAPFAELVAELLPGRDLSRTPLFK